MRSSLVTGCLFALLAGSAALAQTSVTTYQGQLQSDGAPANGDFDLAFRLCSSAGPGGVLQAFPLAGTVRVSVVDGLFTQELTFNTAHFSGAQRWLEIEVDGVTLAPRQHLTSAPYATTSKGLVLPYSGSGNSSAPTAVFRVINAGTGYALLGQNDSAASGSAGVVGTAPNGGTAATHGGLFQNNSSIGRGVTGQAYSPTGTNFGGYFESSSTSGRGVFGAAHGPSGETYGGYFQSLSPSGTGVYGRAYADTGTTYGVHGESVSPLGIGVFGLASATTGQNYGVFGRSDSPSGHAGFFQGRGYFSGNVGIGTTTPASTLEIVPANGQGVRLTGSTTGPRSPGFQLFDEGDARGALGLAETTGAWSADAVTGDIVLRASTGSLLLQTGTGAAALTIDGGNVGIGTTTPAAKLDVNGSIRIATTTRYFSIPPHAFVPGEDGISYELVDNGTSAYLCCGFDGQAVSFSAAVHLPDGAVVTRFQARVSDSGTNENITVALRRIELVPTGGTPGTDPLASVTSSGTPDGVVLVDSTINNATIVNDQYAYYVRATWTVPVAPFLCDITLGAVRIDYTVTSPLP